MPTTTNFEFGDVATIERSLVIKKLGKLQSDDRIALTKILDDIFGA